MRGSSSALRPEPLIEAQRLKLTWPNGVNALQDVAFNLLPGELVAVVGPSGCGKSTLLRLLAGLEQPSAGQLTLRGLPPEQARRQSSPVAFVFQQPTLLPWQTVAENVALPLRLSGAAPSDDILHSLLQRVGLEGFARSYPHQLSGGMQMRVSVARALSTRPTLLLMDEPFAALDELTRQKLQEETLRLWAQEQCTLVLVTHNMFEAAFMAQRVLVMSARPGRILAELSIPFEYPRPRELRASPAFAEQVGLISRLLHGGHI